VPEFRLETERLILRDWRSEDWPGFLRHTNTPQVMRWLGGVLDSAGQAKQRARIEAYQAEHGFSFWLVERKADGLELSGEILGFCGLKISNQPGGPQGHHEIGWRLRSDSWGKGYAREAAIAARDAAFALLDAPHIIALTVQENAPSWGLMRRIGMERRADLDFSSADFGTDQIIAYGLTRKTWEQRA